MCNFSYILPEPWMTDAFYKKLSRQERAIMDVVYRLESAGVSEVVSALGDDHDSESVRVTLSLLARKGHLKTRKDGKRNIYSPKVPREKVRKSALKGVVKNFFEGSPSDAILTMLDISSSRLSPEDLEEIREWIDRESDK